MKQTLDFFVKNAGWKSFKTPDMVWGMGKFK